jgi:biotin carboxylase
VKLLAVEAIQCASYYQSRYRQVEGLGVELYVLNGVGTPDFWPTERYRIAGSKNLDDVVAAARAWHAEEHFEGVLTFAEPSVVTVATVAEALGLPGAGVEAARTSRNKLLMREAHERGGVPHPQFRLVDDLETALATAEEYGYPVILKPTLGAGSHFVFRIDGPDDMRLRFPQAHTGIKQMVWYTLEPDGEDVGPHGLLVESFLDGPEYLTESVIWDDEVYLGSIVDRVTIEGDTFDDDAHHAPTSLTPEQITAVHAVIAGAARAQGLKRSVMHAEVRFHRGEPYILEIAARPGGGGLDYFSRISAGYCPIQATVDIARGVRPNVTHYQPTGVHTAGTCLISGQGRVERVDVPESVSGSDRVFFLKINVKPGDVIMRPPYGNTIVGYLCTTGTSLEDALQAAYDLAAQIDVQMAPIDAELLAGAAR